MSHLSKENDALLKRVRRIAGQVGAIERALAAGQDCATMLHLVAGARGSMNGLMEKIMEAHLREHVARPGLDEKERAAGAEELMAAFRTYGK